MQQIDGMNSKIVGIQAELDDVPNKITTEINLKLVGCLK